MQNPNLSHYFPRFSKVVLAMSIICLYSMYSFFYAQHSPSLGYKVMLVLSFLATFALFLEESVGPSKNVGILYLCFLGLAGASVFFPASKYANAIWLVEAIAKLLLSSVIVLCFLHLDKEVVPFFKWGLLSCAIVLSIVIVLQQVLNVPIRAIVPEFDEFKVVLSNWNKKYYSFWLLFLFWTTISFFWRKGKVETGLAIGIGILTGLALFIDYSDSARMAFVISLVVFALAHMVKSQKWLFMWNSLIYLYIFLFPLVWHLFATHVWLKDIKTTQVLNNVAFRVDVYSASVRAISDQWFIGYGFGSTLSLLPLIVPFETGGHPHNIVLLFWLELGLFGAFLLAAVSTVLLSFIHSSTNGQENGPSVWALLSSGLVIFSFSFDIWSTDVVLIYGMWVAMIMLSCQYVNPSPLEHSHSKLPLFHYGVLTITVIGMASYLVRAIVF